jgi:hypothetical protein
VRCHITAVTNVRNPARHYARRGPNATTGPNRTSGWTTCRTQTSVCDSPASTWTFTITVLLRSRKTSAIVKPGAVRYSEVAAGYHRWMAPAISYVTRPLSPETWDDFAHLVEANNGVWGGCWCMGFHPEGVGKGHTIAGNRLAKQAHVRNETVHQILVYDGDECVGWRRWAQSTMLEVGSSRPTPSKARGAPLSAAPISIRARPTSSRSSASSETG